MQAAEKIYKNIIEGECRPFLSLQSKCNLHSAPCRFCASAQVCHTEKPSLGAIAKEMHNSLSLVTISEGSLYRIKYNMRFRNPELLNTMYPTNLANARYKSAIGQVSSMIKTKIRQ